MGISLRGQDRISQHPSVIDTQNLNLFYTTAFGITEIRCGFKDALSVKFSLLVCETEIQASMSDKKDLSTLLRWILAASENPKSE